MYVPLSIIKQQARPCQNIVKYQILIQEIFILNIFFYHLYRLAYQLFAATSVCGLGRNPGKTLENIEKKIFYHGYPIQCTVH